MTAKEKEAADALRKKMAEKLKKEKEAGTLGTSKDEEQLAEEAARDKTNAEAKRKGQLSTTEEGRDQLEAEEQAKEAKREKIAQETDEGLRDPTGANRAAKKEMERQANLPEVKAANAIKDLGKKGLQELLKTIPGISSDQAEKLTNGLEHVISKGNLDHEGVGVAKDIAIEQAKKAAKEAFDQGVENRRKLMEEKPKGPVVGSPAMPAEVNVHIEGPAAGAAAPAAAAAAGEVISQNVAEQQAPPVPTPAPTAPATTGAPLTGQGRPRRRRRVEMEDGYSSSGSSADRTIRGNPLLAYARSHMRGPKNPKLAVDPAYFC